MYCNGDVVAHEFRVVYFPTTSGRRRLTVNDRLSKLAILVVNYRYDLRDDNDPIEASKDEEVAAVFRDVPG